MSDYWEKLATSTRNQKKSLLFCKCFMILVFLLEIGSTPMTLHCLICIFHMIYHRLIVKCHVCWNNFKMKCYIGKHYQKITWCFLVQSWRFQHFRHILLNLKPKLMASVFFPVITHFFYTCPCFFAILSDKRFQKKSLLPKEGL